MDFRRFLLRAAGFGLIAAVSVQIEYAAPADATESVTVLPGTHIPLALLNTVSTKHSAEGDRVYLQSVFPILVNGRIAIPPGSYVIGTLTHLKRPGRVKGRGELFLRFDSLTLPNGVSREFGARLSGVDASAAEKLDRREGMVKGDGNVGGDARVVAESTLAGASLGTLAGAASHSYVLGAGVGAGAGAAAGLLGVLLSRGPDATLAQGSTVEMVLDRPIVLAPGELVAGPAQPVRISEAPAAAPKPATRPRFPF